MINTIVKGITKMNWFTKLISNNTGLSAKNFFLVVVTFIGCLLLIVPVFALGIEALFNHTITTDLTGMAAYIGAVASLFATAGLTKAWSEKFEHEAHLKETEGIQSGDIPLE